MKNIFTPFAALLSVLGAQAQSTYSFEETTAPYTPLVGATTCTFDANGFDEINELDGQSLQLFGQPFPLGSPYSMVIGDWGFLRFDRTASAVVIDGLFTGLVAVDATSTISYTLTGAPGSYMLTAQWTNWSMGQGPVGNHASWQISIDQATGTATVHIGPNSGGGLVFNDQTGPNCGIFHANSSFTQCLQRVWVEGDPSDPYLDTATNFDFDGLLGFPAPGTLYRFEPATSSGIDQLATPAGFSAFAAADGLHVSAVSGAQGSVLQLLDVAGCEVLRTRVNGFAVLPTTGLAPGAYLLRAVDGTSKPLKVVVP